MVHYYVLHCRLQYQYNTPACPCVPYQLYWPWHRVDHALVSFQVVKSTALSSWLRFAPQYHGDDGSAEWSKWCEDEAGNQENEARNGIKLTRQTRRQRRWLGKHGLKYYNKGKEALTAKGWRTPCRGEEKDGHAWLWITTKKSNGVACCLVGTISIFTRCPFLDWAWI